MFQKYFSVTIDRWKVKTVKKNISLIGQKRTTTRVTTMHSVRKSRRTIELVSMVLWSIFQAESDGGFWRKCWQIFTADNLESVVDWRPKIVWSNHAELLYPWGYEREAIFQKRISRNRARAPLSDVIGVSLWQTRQIRQIDSVLTWSMCPYLWRILCLVLIR